MSDFICTDCGASVVSYDSGYYVHGREDDRARCLVCGFIGAEPEQDRAGLRAHLLSQEPEPPP